MNCTGKSRWWLLPTVGLIVPGSACSHVATSARSSAVAPFGGNAFFINVACRRETFPANTRSPDLAWRESITCPEIPLRLASRAREDTTAVLCFLQLMNQICPQQERQPDWSAGTRVFHWLSISEPGSGASGGPLLVWHLPRPLALTRVYVHRFLLSCPVETGLDLLGRVSCAHSIRITSHFSKVLMKRLQRPSFYWTDELTPRTQMLSGCLGGWLERGRREGVYGREGIKILNLRCPSTPCGRGRGGILRPKRPRVWSSLGSTKNIKDQPPNLYQSGAPALPMILYLPGAIQCQVPRQARGLGDSEVMGLLMSWMSVESLV